MPMEMKQAEYVTKHNYMYLHKQFVICTKASDFKKKQKNWQRLDTRWITNVNSLHLFFQLSYYKMTNTSLFNATKTRV